MSADVTLHLSRSDEGVWSLYANSRGSSKDEAFAAVQMIYDSFTHGHETFIRCMPEVNSDLDFDTKKTIHSGYVRFSFLEKAGPIHAPVDPMTTIGFADLKVAS